MGRLSVKGAVSVLDTPLQSVKDVAGKAGSSRQQVWEELRDNAMIWQVEKPMEEDTIEAMLPLQTKFHRIMLMFVALDNQSEHLPITPEPDGPS